MAQRRGKESRPPHDESAGSPDDARGDTGAPGAEERSEPGAEGAPGAFGPTGPGGRGRETPPPKGAVPEFVRKALTAGFSGFFFTEEAIRKALGDTLPRDWADFAADQSSRARAEFMERLSYEIGRALENLDYATVLAQLLEGRTLEVSASIRLRDDGGRKRRSELRVDVSRKEEE